MGSRPIPSITASVDTNTDTAADAWCEWILMDTVKLASDCIQCSYPDVDTVRG